ncbi:hypothetical protein NHX12_023656 [Muraenolepis orangiensis]|uniref:Methyltransferase domain-containing protein n=1 Tax=Muraenolepis orangiensis TaxID=630683 RepID=A0A9Q0IQ77_9TELE|nr:hypothetical protein NHX12_023656 [Muraenolepis orangiensis]
MRAGVRGALPRVALLLTPPILVAIQLLSVLRLPQDHRDAGGGGGGGTAGEGGGIVYSVISIEPKRSARLEAAAPSSSSSAGTGARPAGGFLLQSWAAEESSLTAELDRVLAVITRPQVNCSQVLSPGESQASQASGSLDLPWLLMDEGDADFIKTVVGLGCQVHRFDPSHSNASGGHLDNSLASRHGDDSAGNVVSHHKMWLEWRSPRKRTPRGKRGTLSSVSRTLGDIMQALRHHTVDFLYANLLSAEWRIFQNWMEQGTLWSIHHLVATLHLQWAGFEVGGTNEEVVRYWFSILHGLKASGFQLVHSSPGEGHSILRQPITSAHSSYTLSWVNMAN